MTNMIRSLSTEKIMEHVKSTVSIQSTIIIKRKGKLMEEMEMLFSIRTEY